MESQNFANIRCLFQVYERDKIDLQISVSESVDLNKGRFL